MDAMVTARVPVEVKEQVSTLLKEDGLTSTELINSAYLYYLQNRKLPLERKLRAGKRKLTAEQKQLLATRVGALELVDAATVESAGEDWL